jgi:hypothetical protein
MISFFWGVFGLGGGINRIMWCTEGGRDSRREKEEKKIVDWMELMNGGRDWRKMGRMRWDGEEEKWGVEEVYMGVLGGYLGERRLMDK